MMIDPYLIALLFLGTGYIVNVAILYSLQKKNSEMMDRIMARNPIEAAMAGKVREEGAKKNKPKENSLEESLKPGEVEA